MKKINFKWLLLSIILSLACTTNVWGAIDFTPTQIASGTTTSGITVSSTFSKSTGKKLCTTKTSEDAISMSSSAGATYNDKYLWITVPANCKITGVSVLTKSNGDSGVNGAVVYWSGAAASTGVTSATTVAAGARNTTDCTGTVDLSVPANTRTVGFYRGPKIKSGAFDSKGSTVGGTSTFNIFSVSVTATGPVNHSLTNASKSSGAITATLGSNYTATYTAADGYALPSDVTVKVGSTTKTKGTHYTWSVSNGVGSLSITGTYVADSITVIVTGESAGPATYTLTNAVSPAGYGTVSPASVTSIPSGTSTSSSSNTYTVNGTTVTATPAASTAQYTYAFSNWSGLPNPVTANATVTAIFTRTPQSYTVTHTLTNVTSSSGTTATYGTDYTATFAASSGYTLPSTITVMRGSTNITANCTWVQATGSLTIPGAQNTGNITVTITGDEDTPACSAPSEPTISGETSYDYNDAISIKATCSSGASGTTTYTWYKGSTWEAAYSAGAIQSAAVAEDYGDYIMKYAVVADAGTYWCEASNGSGCKAHNATGFTISVAKADMPSTGLATGTATSITSTGATLPFTMTSTSGVGSLTIKVYDDNDDVVKTVTNITPATSGSQAVTGLSAGTTYYYTITPIGDANHNDGSETSASSTFTTETVTYSVTYAGNGNTGGTVPSDATTYSPDAPVTVAAGVPTKTNYTFIGWLNSVDNTMYKAGQSFTITAATTLTAQWDGTGSSITLSWFDSSQGSNSGSYPDSEGKWIYAYSNSAKTSTYAYTVTTTSTNNKGQGTGDSDYLRLYYGTSYNIYANNTTTSGTPSTFSNVTSVSLKVKLKKTAPTMTIKVGGTTIANAVSLSSASTSSFTTFTYNNLSNLSGKITITNNGSGSTNYDIYIDDITITCGIPSTAKTVTFNKGSGPSTVTGLPDAVKVPSGSKISRPATDPTATNYIFDGWVTTSGGSTAFDFANTTITTDKTIYAKWTAKTSPGSGTVSGTANICPGSNTDITLSTSVSGASYQLYKDNVASGDPKAGTGSALTWSVSAAGTYTVKAVETATHASGNMSGSATVTIYTALSKTSDPTSSKSATVGVGCALDGLAYTGNANVACQWQSCTDATPTSTTNISDGGAYSNCTTSAMTFTPASTGTYYFRCVVSDDCGSSFNTGVVTVTAKIAPNVYSLSGEPTALCGGTATLTLSGSQSGLNYQLYKGGVAEGDPKAGTGSALTWTVSAAGTYTVKTVETSTYAEATMTGSVSISIMTPTSISTQPTTSVTGHDGVSFTLGSNLVGAGEGTLTYQWYSYTSSGGAGEATVGSATTTKTLTTSKSAGTYYYKVEVIGECGSVKSNMITVTVDNKHYLTYSANNGNGAPSGGYYAPSASVTLNSTTIPTRSGYVFLGWNTNSSGTGDMYQPGATYTMPATATTLYAAWGSPCFSFSKGTKGTEPTDGSVMTPENINSSAFKSGATLSGGTLTNTSGATLGINASNGFVMVKNTRSISVSLGSGAFQAGTVIALEGYTNKNSTAYTYGFSVSGNAAGSPVNESTNAYVAFKQRYVVTAGDGIAGTSSFTLTFNSSATGAQAYLSLIAIGNCLSCTTISPTLTYSATTLYAFGGTPNTATPTLNKDGNTGEVTWSSSNTSAVTVDASGNITAVGAGTATISAELPYDGTHCGGTASCDITVPALVTQTLNVASETAWGTTPALTFTPSDKGMEQVLRLTKNTFTFDSTSTSTKQDGTTKRWMTASFTGSETTKGKYLKMAFKNTQHNLRLGEVVVPIQPISNNGSAQVEIYEGSTLRMTSTAVTGITKGSLTDVHFTFASPYVFAAGSTINVYIYFYGQTTGFRLASPILVNGAVLTDYIYQTSGNWSTAANWNWGKLPLADDNVTILAPATVNTTTAVAKSVVINTDAPNTGKLTIANNGVLTVDETITAIKSGVAAATAVNDVIIDCSKTSQGALIFEQPSSGLQTKGTVNFYTKSSRVGGKLQWQYVGYPFISGYDYDYGGYYINKYSETQGGWIVMRDQGDRSIAAWDGLAISGDDEGGASMTGTFVPTTGDKEFTLTYTAGKGKGKNLIGNSWTAPIQITSLSASDFGGAKATIYIFNTGRYGEKETSPSGSWVTLPVEAVKAAPGDYDITVIPAFQGFQVKTADTEDKTLTLNYDSHVRPATNTMNKPLSAPARRAHSEISHISLTVESDVARQRVHLFEGADFSEAYDNGWDGDYVGVSGQNAYLYVVSPTLGKLAVDAENSLEGRIVALQSAAEKEYTFTFTGDETGYFLNDLKTENSTLISEGNSYTFTYEQGDEYNRFMISATPFAKTTPTGVDKVQGDKVQSDKVRKVLIDDHLYIIRAGKVFDATGGLVK